MKILIPLLFYIISLYANPSWFLHLSSSVGTNTYIGYGIGVSASEAKREALTDIASQIEVKIDSSIFSVLKDEDGKFSKKTEMKDLQKTVATLYDYKLLKSEYEDDNYYVALSYENTPSLDKFVEKIQRNDFAEVEHLKHDHYLSQTPISRELHTKIGKDVSFSLVRKDKKWFIKHKKIMQILDKKDFANFFSSVEDKILTVSTSQKRNVLYDREKFFFKVQSLKSGYISILDVYEDGTVASLLRNVPLKKGKELNIPDKDFGTIPQASLLVKGEETFDLYVFIYSKKKLHFDQFSYADSELITQEKYKNFDELIGFLQDKTFYTLKIITKPSLR